MEKCFDRLEHKAIMATLEYFNFGKKFIRWTSLFYNKFLIQIQNFGFLSEKWIKGRGGNQGCPLSPGLYLLTAEIRANKLRTHRGIKGIKVKEMEYLTSQFADDTDLYLSYDQETITNTFQVLTGIETNTGLRVSYDKTTMYRTGSLAHTKAKLWTPRKITWSNDYINTLRVNLYCDHKECEENILEVVTKMRAVAKMWYFRNMTLYGKVTVINALMASLFVYKMQVLPVITDRITTQVEAVIKEFLWHGKKEKIPLATLMLDKKDGGLNLVNIKVKHLTLLCNWVSDCENFFLKLGT